MFKKSKIITFIFLFKCVEFLYGQDISNGLISYWNFDNNLNDKLSTKVFSNYGNINYENSIFGTTPHFDGSNYVYLKNIDSTRKLISEQGFSWCFWFKCDKLSTSSSYGYYQTLISCKDIVNFEDIYIGFGSEKNSQKDLVVRIDGISGAGGEMPIPLSFNPIGGFQDDKWYHLAVVRDYDSDSLHLFLNGEKVTSTFFKISPINRDMYFSLAADYDGNNLNSSTLFKGMIDEFRVYNKVLSNNEIINIYELNKSGLTSDNELNFGELICQKYSEKSIYVKNINKNEIQISAKLLNATDFKIVSISKLNLKYLDSAEIRIKFSSNNKGDIDDRLIISNNMLLPDLNIPVFVKKMNINYFSNLINNKIYLDKVLYKTKIDTSFVFQNNGDRNIEIVNILSNDNKVLISTNKNIPATILPYESIIVNLLTNINLGQNINKFKLCISHECGFDTLEYSIEYLGYENAKATFKIGDIYTAKVGNIIEIPIILKEEQNLSFSGLNQLNIKINVNPSILFPTENYLKKYSENNRLSIEYFVDILYAKQGDTLTKLKFRTELGNSDIDTLRFMNINSSGIIKDSLIDGIFAIDNICKNGGIRLFDYSGFIKLEKVSPNPGSGILTLDFELIENGLTKIEIYNENGIFQKELLNQYMDIGKYILNFNTYDLNSGDYIIYMTTPTNKISNKLIIMK